MELAVIFGEDVRHITLEFRAVPNAHLKTTAVKYIGKYFMLQIKFYGLKVSD